MKEATFTCPACNAKEVLAIPSEGCLAFQECITCHEIATAKDGLCVICAYTNKKCAHPCMEETI